MATITITTTNRQDFGAARETEAYNASSGGAPLTPVQYVTQRLFHILDSWATKYEDVDRVTKVELYQRATAADRAAVDAILNAYR